MTRTSRVMTIFFWFYASSRSANASLAMTHKQKTENLLGLSPYGSFVDPVISRTPRWKLR